VALVISAIAATAGYYLQTRLRRLEELELQREAAHKLWPPTPAREVEEKIEITEVPIQYPSIAVS